MNTIYYHVTSGNHSVIKAYFANAETISGYFYSLGALRNWAKKRGYSSVKKASQAHIDLAFTRQQELAEINRTRRD